MPKQRPGKKLLSVYLDQEKYDQLKDNSPNTISDTINRLVDLFLEGKIELEDQQQQQEVPSSNNDGLEELIEQIVDQKIRERFGSGFEELEQKYEGDIVGTKELAKELGINERKARRLFEGKEVGDSINYDNGSNLIVKLIERSNQGNWYEIQLAD